jgi:hypothetical protein
MHDEQPVLWRIQPAAGFGEHDCTVAPLAHKAASTTCGYPAGTGGIGAAEPPRGVNWRSGDTEPGPCSRPARSTKPGPLRPRWRAACLRLRPFGLTAVAGA